MRRHYYDRREKSLDDVISQATRLRILSYGSGNPQRATKVAEIAGRYQKKLEFLTGLDRSTNSLTSEQINRRRKIKFGRTLYAGIQSKAVGGAG